MLWSALTEERSTELSQYFRKPALRRAYLGYYLPIYANKIAQLIKSLNIKLEAPKVLDLGAGPLSGILGAHLAFGKLSEVLAVDQDLGPMKAGLEFIQGILKDKSLPNIKFARANLKGPPKYWKPRFKPDLIIMAHVLNEFGSGERYIEDKKTLIAHAVNQLAPKGILLIVEPASKVPTRDLMRLRDWLYQEAPVEIIAPCPPKVETCPLLKDRNTWCHAELNYKRPKELLNIDLQIGLNRDSLKCSYLAISKQGAGYKPTNCRIVSGPMSARGVHRRYACTPEGLLTLAQSERDKNQILSKLTRGDAFELNQAKRLIEKP